MKKIIYLFVMLPIVITYGCASTSDHRQLRLEFEHLKYESEKQYSELQNDMALFKDAYNPELHELFSENLSAAERYRKLIKEIKNDMEDISDKINILLRESENDRLLISENLKTATVENIINEFRQLNNKWETTVFELTNLVKRSERAIESSHQAAIQAAEKAGSAERSADYVYESMDLINEQSKSLSRMREKVKNIELKIRKINKQLNEIDEPNSNSRKGKIR
jgi:methyl-accepting chemotaxis protein